jgi:hypothetical protein
MSFFNPDEPLLRRKQTALDIQDLKGLISINWRVANVRLFGAHYTRIDQIFLLWGLLVAVIFITAQFMSIAWETQAIYWTVLTIAGAGVMLAWSWYWAGVEKLRWVIWCWLALLGTGLGLTDWGVLTCQPGIMSHLCHLWLGLNAIGYCLTGLGVRSRSLNLVAIAHLLGCFIVSYTPDWQFLLTGLIMTISLLLLGEYQWDMRLPSEFANLTDEQMQFNQQQHLLRQSLHRNLVLNSQGLTTPT